VLGTSSNRLAKLYGKNQHTTPMRGLVTAKGLVETNKTLRLMYKSAMHEVQSAYNAEIEKKTIKQIYNLNHRVREKGISVRTRSRTLSISENDLIDIKDTQLKKLLDKHHYAIQFTII
jgi:hypothetical protein